MSLALKVYELFKDDEAKAKGLAEVFSELEDNFLPRRDAATGQQLEHVNLSLRLEIEKTRNDLTVEIEKTRSDMAVGFEKVKVELERLRADLMKQMNRQVLWVVGAVSIVIGALKALDYILK